MALSSTACLVFPGEITDAASSSANLPPRIVLETVLPSPEETSVLEYGRTCSLLQNFSVYVEDANTDRLYYKVFIDYAILKDSTSTNPQIADNVIPANAYDSDNRALVSFDVSTNHATISRSEQNGTYVHSLELLIADRPFEQGRVVGEGGLCDRYAWILYRSSDGPCQTY